MTIRKAVKYLEPERQKALLTAYRDTRALHRKAESASGPSKIAEP